MKKHLGNMISWSSVFITVITLILVMNEVLPINYLVISIILAFILDFFDGKVARRFVSEPKDFIFGELTDSLCDTINFGIMPIVYLNLIFLNKSIIILSIVSIIYIWAIIFRLARFSREKNQKKVGFYAGLPVTVAGAVSASSVYLFNNSVFLVVIIYIFLAILMASTIKFKRI